MSVRVMEMVWSAFPGEGPELLMMLALADFADDWGGRIHPSIATLGRKVRRSPDQTRRTLHVLISRGFVRVVANEHGGRPGTTRHYQIELGRLKTAGACASPTPDVDASRTPGVDASRTAGADTGNGLHACKETAGMHASQSVIEPSGTVKEESARACASLTLAGELRSTKRRKVTFAEYVDQCEANGVLPIPEDDAVFALAANRGIDEKCLQLAWQRFSERYLNDSGYTGKRYTDWRQVFRNAVRDNWFRLWRPDDAGGCRLTDQGVLEQRAARASA
jgi:hypothetical protein